MEVMIEQVMLQQGEVRLSKSKWYLRHGRDKAREVTHSVYQVITDVQLNALEEKESREHGNSNYGQGSG